MHPLIRVVCLLLAAGFVATAKVPVLLFSLVAIASIYLLVAVPISACAKALRRMRWFFLSILLVYFWFTPGHALAPALADNLWIPTIEGVEQGLLRVLSLATIIAAVTALLETTTRDALFSAIYRLLESGRWLGWSPQRFAVRVTLTLEYLAPVQDVVAGVKGRMPSGGTLKARLQAMVAAVATVFAGVYDNAQRVEPAPIMLHQPAPVPLWQWLYPAVLVSAYILLTII